MSDFLGDIPTWITTIAVALAVLQYFADRRRRRAEAEREEKAQASGLTAWTVTDVDPDNRRHGVALRNDSGSTYHDVTVTTRLHGERQRAIALTILPPGEYVIWRNPAGSKFDWGFAQSTREDHSARRPYMNSEKYGVDAIDFSDNLGQHWHSNDRAVLVRRT